ncbi:hypothetical protein BC830DRAFT_1079365 [Chytriomyces sp. MP71]|nr:hypothetical protein BC830DRAFT_1079365 [Chytriomyces sp. MP71]
MIVESVVVAVTLVGHAVCVLHEEVVKPLLDHEEIRVELLTLEGKVVEPIEGETAMWTQPVRTMKLWTSKMTNVPEILGMNLPAGNKGLFTLFYRGTKSTARARSSVRVSIMGSVGSGDKPVRANRQNNFRRSCAPEKTWQDPRARFKYNPAAACPGVRESDVKKVLSAMGSLLGLPSGLNEAAKAKKKLAVRHGIKDRK